MSEEKDQDMMDQDSKQNTSVGSEQDNQEEHYDLYTEHIVQDPWEKVKRWIKKGFILLGMAVIFGLIAGLIMIIVYRSGSRLIEGGEKPTATVTGPQETERQTAPENVQNTEESTQEETTDISREDITLSVEDQTTEVTSATEPVDIAETQPQEILDLAADYEVLKQLVAKVNRSMVTVSVSTESVDWFTTTYQNITEEYGLVIANNEAGCYVVTDYDLVKGNDQIKVTFPNKKELSATLLCGDETTGLAVLLTETITDAEASVAVLAGSGSIAQGDFVIAVGKIYGFAGSMGYGIATSTSNYVNDTDASFQLINTNITGTGNSAGVLANLKGEIVGFITTSYNSEGNNLVSAYSVNSVKTIIENLSNCHDSAYLGIRGQEVTPLIALNNGLPNGIYITAVESNSPAFKAGLQSGDIITNLDGKDVYSMEDFMEIMEAHFVGDTMSVTIERKGRETYKAIDFRVILGVE